MDLYSKDENLVNLSNSVLKAYQIKTFHPSLKPVDDLLKSNNVPFKKLCFILLDGFGTYIQDTYKDSIPFIYNHSFMKITSVFPPTTVAATTSFLTGKYPCETGWMGWTEKFPQYEDPITMFPSTFIHGAEKTPIPTDKLVPIKYITTLINKEGFFKANRVMGFKDEAPGTDVFFTNVQLSLKRNDFTYAYWTDPDSTLHQYGVCSEEVRRVVSELDSQIKKIVQLNRDVLFITLADHGHINCKYLSIYEHEDFFSCLRFKDFSNEPRASVFYVKPDKLEEFRKLGERYYGQYFAIFSKQEVIDQKIFGVGEKDFYFNDLIGDFLFVAKGEYCFSQDTTATELISHHAGGTIKERYITLGVYNSK